MKVKKMILWIFAIAASLVVLFLFFVWLATYHPSREEPAPVKCSKSAPRLKPGQSLKLLTWNVQFMAGKNYVFFYDLPDGSGPDERPSSEAIRETLDKAARVIRDEDPDIILLQEVDDGAKRTDYEDQLERLMSMLAGEYCCSSEAFYWKARFVPHPRIMGAVGMKLGIISKYRISRAVRHQLPLMPANPVTSQFYLKRAVLEVRMPVDRGRDFVVLNTHLDAFAQGTDTMERQVGHVKSLLEKLTAAGHPWAMGGDFNLLPPGKAYGRLAQEQKRYFKQQTEIMPLFKAYQAVPGPEEVNGPGFEKWFTHLANDPRVTEPDRTIDYFFLADSIRLGDHYVRQHDTLSISDHLPVVVQVELPYP